MKRFFKIVVERRNAACYTVNGELKRRNVCPLLKGTGIVRKETHVLAFDRDLNTREIFLALPVEYNVPESETPEEGNPKSVRLASRAWEKTFTEEELQTVDTW